MDEAPSTGSLQLTVTFHRAEQSAAHWAAMRGGPLLRRPAAILCISAVGGFLIVWGSRVLQRIVHPAVPGAVQVLILLLLVGLAAYGLRHSLRLREEVERHEGLPDVYTLDGGGLEIAGVEDLTLMSWSSMTRVHETDRFFLFVSGSEVQYLPKRVLDAAQEAQVRALVARHAPVAGRPRLRS
jgi:hypothetical protein